MILTLVVAAVQQLVFSSDLLANFEPTVTERRAQEKGTATVRIHDTRSTTSKVVQGELLVRAPVRVVWGVVTDYSYYPRLFSRMLRSEVRQQAGDWEEHYSLVQYPWPYGPRWVLTTIHHDNEQQTVRFRRLDGTIRELEGIWQMREHQLGARLQYAVRLDPGLPFIPSWIITWGTSFMLPDILRSVKTEAERRNSKQSP
ncbi:MAG: hypothetical protein HY692_07710 [Cyanobacteria bacterium NC_groundwater_1444_Ag_S-0.65um_54_12]|nr:hypothetical protein [Cyanobacteria bacterium NC_groundwater_1444_Ag_S-0.65um_54_12]